MGLIQVHNKFSSPEMSKMVDALQIFQVSSPLIASADLV
jgi:hypothetical protein